MNPALYVLGKGGTNIGTENQKVQFSSKEIQSYPYDVLK